MIELDSIKLRNFEDNYTLSRLEKIFFAKRGWLSRIPKQNSSVILLLSGGIDTVSLWALLMERYRLHVYPIFVQNTSIKKENSELKSVKYFSELYKKKYPTFFHKVFIKNYSFSFSFSEFKGKKNISVDLPTMFHNLLNLPDQNTGIPSIIDSPSRLGIYSYCALEYAYILRLTSNVYVNSIFFGIVPEDGLSIRESTQSVLKSINLSLCLILGDFNWQIMAPIDKKAKFYYEKKDLVRYTVSKNIPIDHSWSCRAYNKYHCGVCFSCITRKNVFNQVNFPDSTIYTNSGYSEKRRLLIKLKKIKNSLINNTGEIVINKKKSHTKILSGDKITTTNKTSWYEMRDKIYLMGPNNNQIEQLDSVGAFIWREIVQKECTFSYLLTQITDIYAVTKAKSNSDLKSFLLDLEKKGYIRFK